jgi:hypothetical protein
MTAEIEGKRVPQISERGKRVMKILKSILYLEIDVRIIELLGI